MNHHRSGFTMVELVIVVLILGITTAVAAPRYLTSLNNFRCDATARRIAADIRMVQQQAKKTSADRSVVFDIANNLVEMPGIMDLDHRGQAYQFHLGQSDYQATLLSADFAGGPLLRFDIYGRPTTAGFVRISVGGTQRLIAVDDSGRVTLP